ncbi:TIGR03086 family metal-binding protein [Actinokineospora sp. HUAS TT18]|uniref:TIGR03086 family metal-binding protein n=1 Tax=Actinokineospora sp. HUAS TT18 TaxID=3447451 RepID=UPI003F5252C0
MTLGPDLQLSADRVADVIAAIDESTLDDPTPCTEYRVREILGHMDTLTQAFRAAAAKDLGELTDRDPTAAVPTLADGWRDRIPTQLDALVHAWRSPEAWSGMTRAGGVDLPGEVAGIIALNEITLHGWDLAVATRQAYPVDEKSARACLSFVETFGDDRPPIFGPAVPVAAGAPVFDQVLALSGRNPDWTP